MLNPDTLPRFLLPSIFSRIWDRSATLEEIMTQDSVADAHLLWHVVINHYRYKVPGIIERDYSNGLKLFLAITNGLNRLYATHKDSWNTRVSIIEKGSYAFEQGSTVEVTLFYFDPFGNYSHCCIGAQDQIGIVHSNANVIVVRGVDVIVMGKRMVDVYRKWGREKYLFSSAWAIDYLVRYYDPESVTAHEDSATRNIARAMLARFCFNNPCIDFGVPVKLTEKDELFTRSPEFSAIHLTYYEGDDGLEKHGISDDTGFFGQGKLVGIPILDGFCRYRGNSSRRYTEVRIVTFGMPQTVGGGHIQVELLRTAYYKV